MIDLGKAATTAVLPEAQQAAVRAMNDCYGNPSSQHPMGRAAKEMLVQARGQVALALGVPQDRVFFTSCGTESTNTALLGAARKTAHTGGRHNVSTSTWHSATP